MYPGSDLIKFQFKASQGGAGPLGSCFGGEISPVRVVRAREPPKSDPLKVTMAQTPSAQLLQGNAAVKPSLKQGGDRLSLEFLCWIPVLVWNDEYSEMQKQNL